MNITQVCKGPALKTVHVEDVTDETDTNLIDAALKAAREDRTSLFGISVNRSFLDGEHAVVELWTD